MFFFPPFAFTEGLRIIIFIYRFHLQLHNAGAVKPLETLTASKGRAHKLDIFLNKNKKRERDSKCFMKTKAEMSVGYI